MELAAVDISVQASSFADLQPTPVPMEVEPEVLSQVPENPEKAEQAEITQCVENNDTIPDPDAETVSAEDEDNNNELKETILKGILKYEHIYGLDKKKVDFDLDIELIPYDSKDYTVEIQIVKELPKRVVSYRELFKKMAQEEKTKDKDDKPAEDDEDEPEETKAFSQLVLKEPPIHHSTNDIDVSSFKALKAATGQNEKKEDIANSCQQDAFPKEEENNSLNLDISQVVEKSKFSVTPVNELLEYPSNINLGASELTEKLIINNDNTLVNGDIEHRTSLNQITLDQNIIEKPVENDIDHTNIILDMETNIVANNRRSCRNKELAKHNSLLNDSNEKSMDLITEYDEDDSLFDCGHEYLYSEYNEDYDDESIDSKLNYLTNDKRTKALNGENTNVEPVIPLIQNCQNEKMNHVKNSLLIEDERSQNDHKESMQKVTHDIGHNNNNNNHENQNHKEIKHSSVDINYVNGPIQDKHHQVILESIKEERSFNLSRENTDVSTKENEHFEMAKISTMNVKNESDSSLSEPSSTSESNSFKLLSATGKNEANTLDEHVDKAKGIVDRRAKEDISKRDIGIQTDFEFPYPSHCLLCTCKEQEHTGQSEANGQEHNVERFQNSTLPSLNSDENIAMLASDADLCCQEDKSATDSSEGNFRDFTQSTNLDCSSSLSMESFEMDDNSLRIDMVNGILSSDVSI